MTETLLRRRVAPEPVVPDATSPFAVVVFAPVFAAVAGLLIVEAIVLLAWAADAHSGSSTDAALRTGAQLWLAAHRVPLRVNGALVAFAPLGLTVLVAALQARAAGQIVRRIAPTSLRGVAACALAAVVPYVTAAVVVSELATTRAVVVNGGWALLTVATLGLACSVVGAARGHGWARVAAELPPLAVATFAAAAAAVMVLLVGGGVLVGASLAWHADRAAELSSTVAPGIADGVMLALAGLALVPNAVVWGAVYCLGPGFAVGTGTAVGPLAVRLAEVPALPLLSALPASGAPAPVARLALLVAVAAGVAATHALLRRQPGVTVAALAGCVGAAGALTGIALALLSWIAGGSVGAGRLSAVGPSPWRAALAATVWVSLGGVVSLWVHARRARRAGATG